MTMASTFSAPARRGAVNFARVEAALLDLSSVSQAALEALSLPEELTTCAPIRSPSMRKRKLASATLSRAFLADEFGGAPRDWRVVPDLVGAPSAFLCGKKMPVHISRSHADNVAIVALSTDAAVGVDVERIAPHACDAAFANHWFSPDERLWLAAAGPEGMAERFFRLWTLKEAYLKARGLGFTMDPRRVSIRSSDAGGFSIDADTGEEWAFESQILNGDHCLSCAASADQISLSLHETRLGAGAFAFCAASLSSDMGFLHATCVF